MALTKITPQMFDTSATAHDLNVDNGTFVVDGSASRVGIGTATPSTLLDVNGPATFSSTITAGSTIHRGNLTIDSQEIDVGSGSLTLDVAGDITLDADGADINFSDGGTLFGQISNASGLYLVSNVSDAPMYLRGNDGGSYVNAIAIDFVNGGRVGIKEGSPGYRLVVREDVAAGSDLDPVILHLRNGSDGGAGILFSNSVNGQSKISFGVEGTGASTDETFLGFSTGANGGLSERMRIDSSGRVGIGTTSPNQLLEVGNSSGGATINISTDQAAGSIASKKFTNLDFSGYNNTVMARIQSWDESSSTGHGYLTFHTIPSGGSLTERMRIDYSGAVGIGTATPQSYYSKNLVVLTDGDGTAGLTLVSPATDDTAYLCFADGTSGAATYAGYLGYAHASTEKIFMGAGGATQKTILSNGRTAIGGNHTPAHALHVKGAVSATGGVSAVFDGTDSTNTYIQIKNSNSGNSWQIGATGSGVRFYNDQTSSHALGISATGAVEAGAGTVSLPGISFLSDLNSGLYQPAADQVGVVAGGSRKLLITATDAYFQNLSGTVNIATNVNVTGQGDFSTSVLVGTQNSEFSENNLRFRSGGHAYIDHMTAGQDFIFRTSSSSSLDRTAFTIDSSGLVFSHHNLGVRTSTRWNGGTPSYALTISADSQGNAIEVYRTSNSKMLQYMSSDGKYYFDLYGSSTPEIRFRNNGTDWMRTQGTHLFVGGSAPLTKGAGTTTGGTGSNQTILQVQGAVDMGYQGRYTAGLWGPAIVSSTGAYTHLRTAMWGGGSPHGNSEYIMGGFIITGYRYVTAGDGNLKEMHQFHNWNGTMYNYTKSSMLGNNDGWSGTGTVCYAYVDSTGYVTIALPSNSSSYRMFMVDYIQYSQYGKISAEITAITVSNSGTV